MDKKEKLLIQRNDKGEIIPVKVHLAIINEDFLVMPMTRGEVLEMMAGYNNKSTDADLEVVRKHLVEPKYTEDEFKAMKWNAITMLAAEIFKISGIEVSLDKKEEDIKKNSTS